ncbi:MAG: trypsin-like serine protease, partial [Holophagales bacterium]|nr:trypsin-like serine protease [Holophagales bacterium]
MPLPRSVEGDGEMIAPSRLVSFDLESRSETIADEEAAAESGLAENHRPGSQGDWTLSRKREDAARAPERNFSDLAFVPNPEDYPWRVAVKLFMQVRDTSGVLRSFVCSGSLIDPLHVVTAGHCVYFHDAAGYTFDDWAESITVVPGYENGARPYGSSEAVQLHSFVGWTSNEDLDHDIGIIDLDRPVGALTGWHGYGWYGNCSSFTGNSDYRHAGYPAASPYNGQLLYTNAGSYDSCESVGGVWYGNEVRFQNQSWGGQSGSGSYRPNGSCPSCVVRAVLSNGTNSYTDDVRINEEKFGSMISIIGADTPSTVDFVPLDVNVSPTSIMAGATLSGGDLLLHNYSSAVWSGTVDIDLYLSTNDFISTSDQFLQGYSWTGTLSSKSSVRLNFDSLPPTIPAGTGSGTYWVGSIVDFADANPGNNNTEGFDSAEITVSGAPDLVVLSPSVSDTTLSPGQSFTASATVQNQGTGSSVSTTLRYYSSSNSTVSPSDTQLGTDPVVPLGSGQSSPESELVGAPTTPGTYWIGACVDAVSGEASTSN